MKSANTQLFVFLCYKDPAKVIEQLCSGLGFEKVVEYPDEDESGIAHAELKLGGAVVIIQTDHKGYEKPKVVGDSVGFGPYITLESEQAVRDLHTQAVKSNMVSLVAPESTGWGNYRCELLDLEGFQWSIGTYVPGETPSW